MVKRKKYLFIVFFLFLLVVFVLIGLLDNNEDENLIDLEKAKVTVKEDVEAVKDLEEQVFKMVEENDLDAGYLAEGHDNVLEHYQHKEGTVEFLFASILLNDPELFLQSFKTEVISDDLFQVDNLNKLEVAEGFIQEISREGKLESVGYKDSSGILGTEANQGEVKLIYSDGLEVKLTLDFEKNSTSHHDSEIYFITTSVLEIINTIKSTNNH